MNCEIYSFGEPLVGFYSKSERSLSQIGDFHMTWGGDTSNVALAAAKLAHSSGYITRLGTDAFGRGLMKLWESNGVDTSNVRLDSENPTGMYFISFNGASHEFSYRRKDAAAAKFGPRDAETVELEGIKILHLSGISQAISRDCLEASFILMKRAKALGAKISYDLNYRNKLWSPELARTVYLNTIQDYADIVSFNEQEKEILCLSETSEEDALKRIIDLGASVVAFRRGSRGAIIGTAEKIVEGTAKKVEVTDTVGAGDAFMAALLCCTLEGATLEKTLQFSLVAAALACTATGSTEGQPTRREVDNFLGGNPVTQ